MLLTCAVGYSPKDIDLFLKSLRKSGFDDRLVVVFEGPSATKMLLQEYNAKIVKLPHNSWPLNSRRFLAWKDVAQESLHGEQIIISDIRDVVWQGNPSEELPRTGLNSFCEYAGQTIGSCPYNSEWIMSGFGIEIFQRLKYSQIICAGITCGESDHMRRYLRAMIDLIGSAPLVRGYDQAAHNIIFHTHRLPCRIYPDQDSPVHTVGYYPRETLTPKEDQWLHTAYGRPCAVHQYDRHENLKSHFGGMFE